MHISAYVLVEYMHSTYFRKQTTLTSSKWWLRQNESTEKAEKLMTPSEGQDHIEPHTGI